MPIKGGYYGMKQEMSTLGAGPMARRFMHTVLTPSVLAAQEHYYGRRASVGSAPGRNSLTEEERSFIQARDSFYMATVTESGWPYIQHRGGRLGFLHVVSPTQLAFADYQGNRQMLSTGNLAANDRVALFLMDYPRRERLKILGRARINDVRQHPELVAQFAEPEARGIVERVFVIDVLWFDWNCPKYITPRYTVAEVEGAVAPLKQRIAELETQLKTRN
jgi:predicted pyridoxine 5'-phosphate oxidase superfamily flavin-nucleotide-binding protein